MPEPLSELLLSIAAQVQHDADQVDEMLATFKSPSQADLAELQRVGGYLDRWLAVLGIDVGELIDEFAHAHNRQSST